MCRKTMQMQTSSHFASLIVIPDSEDSLVSTSSFEVLILQIIKKNIDIKKKRIIIDASSKVITSEEWISDRKIKEKKIKSEGTKTFLTSAIKERCHIRKIKLKIPNKKIIEIMILKEGKKV